MRLKLLCIFILFSFCNNSVVAQAPAWQWAKEANSTGTEQAWDIAYDSFSNGVFVGGSFNGNLSSTYGASLAASYGQSDGFVAKYDATGNVIWAFKIGGTDVDEVKSIATDGLGNVYVSGNFRSVCDFDPSASNFILTPSGGAGSQDGFLAKYNSLGNLVWATKFGNSLTEVVWRMFADANGIYFTGSYVGNVTFNSASPSVVTKTTTANQGAAEFFGAKYDFNGVAQWVVSGSGLTIDAGYDVVADANAVYFIGDFDRDLSLYNANGTLATIVNVASNNKVSAFIASYSQSSGTLNWATNMGSNTNDVHGGGITHDNLNLYITGSFDGTANFPVSSPLFTKISAGNNDVYLAKLSKSTGVYQWVSPQTGIGTGDESGYEIVCDAGGNLLIAGYFTSSVTFTNGTNFTTLGNQDIIISSYNNAGNFLWAARAGATNDDIPYGLTTNTIGGVYIAGSHNDATVFGTYTLTNSPSTNIFLAKSGCETATNNTIAVTQTICTGSTPSGLTGSLPSGGNFVYKWEQSLNNSIWTPAIGTNTNQNYAPPLLLTTTYYRRNVLSGYSCGSGSISNTVIITVTLNPDISVAGSSQTICVNTPTALLSANVPTMGIGTWSVISGSGNIVTNTLATSVVSNLGAGNNILRWTVSSGPCAVNNSTLLIRVDNSSGPATVGSNQTICSSTTALSASSPTAGLGLWSLIAGTGTLSSAVSLTPNVSGISTGTNTFLWTVTNGVCPSATTTVSIFRDAVPISNAGINQTICAVISTLAAITQTFGIGSWSVIAGTSTLSNPNSPTPSVSGISTGTNTYLWTVTNGVCPTATAIVSIFRDDFPIANAGTNQTICALTSTLAAITQTFGTGFWSVVAGTSTLSNVNIASPNLSGISTGTNTYLWTVANGVCPTSTAVVSIYRDAFPIANAGTNQTICALTSTLAAITQTFGTGVWSVVAGTSTLSNLNVANPNVAGIGTGTNTYLWTVANGVCPTSTAVVSIFRDDFPIANAGTNQTICALTSTLAAITQTFGTGVWSVVAGTSTLSNVNIANPNISGISTGTNTYLWTVANGVCPTSTAMVSIYRDAFPIANAGTNQTICALTSTLSAITQTFGTGVWSVVAGSSALSNVNIANPNISGISTGTNTYLWTVANGVCPTSTAVVSIYRDAVPIANAGSNQTICALTSTLAAITQTFGTGVWSVVAGTSTLSNVNIANPNISGINTGTNTYLWTVSNGVCPTSTAMVSIYRDAFPIANAGSNQTICALTSTLAAITQTFGTGFWSVVAGTSTLSNVNIVNPNVSGIGTGTNTYLWTVANGVCPTSTAVVSIFRDDFPIANAGTNQTICALTSTLAAITQTFGTGVWSVVAGTSTVSNVNIANPNISGISTGTNTYLWTVSNGVCPTSTAVVSIYRDAFPIAYAGANQTICALTSTLAAITQTFGTGFWSVVAGTSTLSNVNIVNPNVSGIGTGTNTYLWTVANGVCPTSTAVVSIFRDDFPIANAGTNQTICALTSTLAAITQTFGTGVWSVVAGTSTVSNVNIANPNISGISTGTNTYLWTVSNGVCPTSTAVVSIYRDAFPIAYAGANQTICALTSTLSAISQTFGTGVWSVVAGTSTLSNVNIVNPDVSGISTGTNTYLWTVSNGVCPTSTAVVSIYRDAFPIANAGTNQTICALTSTLAAITQTFGTGVWSVVAGSSALSNVNISNPNISGIGTGTNTYLWTVSNGVCPTSTAVVSIYRDAFPIANAGTNQTICALTSTLSAISQTFGTGVWSVVAGPSTISNVNIVNPNVSGIGTGTNTYLWTVANGVCPTSTAVVSIFRDDFPIANAGTNQTICALTSTLAAITQTFGTGVWSVVAGTSTVSNVNIANPNISGISTGTNTYLWTVSNGVCPTSTAMVSIYRDAFPIANAGSNQTICALTSTLAAVTQTFGTGFWSVVAGTSTLSNVNIANPNISGISTGTNTYLWTVTNGVCPTSTAVVSIYRDDFPIANAGTNQTICALTSTLAAITQTFGTGVWSVVAGTSTVSNVNISNPNISGISTGTNTYLWTVSNGVCPTSTAVVSIYRDAFPIANAGTNQTICALTSTLAAISQTFGTGVWSVVAGPSAISNLNIDNPNISGIGTGTNTYLWAVSNGVCPTSTAVVSIYRDAFPIANAGTNQTICALTSTLSAITQTFGTGVWSVVAGSSALSNANISNPNISGISTGTNTYLWTVSNGVCPTSTAMVSIYRDAFPIANAGSNQTICALTSTLAAVTQTFGTGFWSVVAGTSTLSNVNIANPNISGISTGTNTYLWTVANGVCPTSTAVVSIFRDDFPIANAGSNQTICALTSTLAAITQTFVTGVWSVIAGSSALSNVNIANPNISGIGTGTNTYLWTVSNGVCPTSTAVVSIYRDAFPIANAGTNQTICALTSTLSAISQTFGTGVWSVVAGPSTISNVNIVNPNVSGIGTGTNTYLWTVANGVCPTSTAVVSIFRDDFPIANAGSNQTICALTSTLAAITQTFGTGVWSVIVGPSMISNVNIVNPNISGIGTGTNTYLWTVSNGVCPTSTAVVSIYRDAFPIANAGTNQTICALTSTLSAISQTFGTGVWSVVAGPSTISNVNIVNPNVSGIGTGTNTYLWTVANGVCPTSTAVVSIFRDDFPIANAGTNQTICALTSTLAAITQTFGTGVWSVVVGTSTVSNVNIANPNISGIGTGTNTYLWTVANGVCPTSTATVSIYRDAFPIANAGTNQTICALTSTLSAISQTFGTGVWSVVAGPSTISNVNIVNPNVSGIGTGTNTYLWAVSNGVCPTSMAVVSIYRDAFPIANAGSNQTICASTSTLSAITQTFGTGVWSVVAGSSTVSNIISPTTIVSGVNTGTNTYLWTVSNGVCPTSTAIVSIIRDNIGTLANAGINQTVCASAAVLTASSVSVGSGTWTTAGTANISNPNATTTPVTGLVTGTNTFIWTVINGVCPSSTAAVTIVRDALPGSANAGSDQTICSPTTVLAATPPTFGSGYWTTVFGPAVVTSSTSATSNVTGIVTGTNTFLWTAVNGVCPSATAVVNVYHDIPPVAIAGADQTVCVSTATLNATIQNIGTGTWSVLTGGGSFLSTTSATTNVTSVGSGSNTYMWLYANGVCPFAYDTVLVFREQTPIANAGISQTVCAVTATLSAITQTFGTGTWSVIAGNSTLSSIISSSPGVSGLGAGVNIYEWSVTYASCPVVTNTVSIYRDAFPVANAGTNQTLCAGTSTLAAITQTFGTGIWSVVAGTSSISSLNSATTNISGINTGTNSYLWTVSNGVCPTATALVSIYRDVVPLASAGSDQTICVGNSTLAAITQTVGSGTWSVLMGGGIVSIVGSATTSVSGIGTGTNAFIWTYGNGTCLNATDTVYIFRDAIPVANAGINQTVCALGSTLSAITQTFGTGAWSVLSGGASLSGITSYSTNVTGLNTGNNIFQWAVTNGVCPVSTSTVTIFRDSLPAANAGINLNICSSDFSLAALSPVNGTGTWSVLTGGSIIASLNSATTNVSGINTGTNTFLWTVSTGVCPPSTATVSIVRDQIPGPVNAGVDQVICSATASVNAVTPANGVGSWSTIGGSGIFVNPNAPATNLSGLSTGNNRLLWTVVNGSCPPAFDTIVVKVDEMPTLASANKDRAVCSDTTTMAANIPVKGVSAWRLVSGAGVISDSTSNIASIKSLSVGINIFSWNIKNGVCPVSSDEIMISRDELPSVASAGVNQKVDKPVAQLSATKPIVGKGLWSVVEGLGTIEDAMNPVTNIVGLAVGNNLIRWKVENGVCLASVSDVAIYVDALRIPTGFSPNGDGINDTYVVPGIDYYDNVKISVFNRWGGLVYHNGNYKNEWNGTNLNKEPLADDTYYYTIKISPEMNYSGYVIIKTK